MSKHTATELLIEAREFIADPERWCQGKMALDECGNPLASGRDPSAAKCCAMGSLQRTFYAHERTTFIAYDDAGQLLHRAARQLYPASRRHQLLTPLAWVNDHLDHAAVLRVYDAAIAASQEASHA